jgi:hypothetical protein
VELFKKDPVVALVMPKSAVKIKKKDEPWLKGRCAGSRKIKKVNLHLTGMALVCSIFGA